MAVFNSGVRGKRAKDGAGVVGTATQFVQKQSPIPAITGYAISGVDDTALNPTGGQTVLVNGSGFVSGLTVMVGTTSIGSVTVVNPNQISFTSPALASGSYTLLVANSSGTAAILVPGLTYSSIPTFTTSAGSIGSFYETTALSTSVTATSDSSLTYSLASGSLPSGATLYANGVISGTTPVDSASTTYNFSITATDAELQDVTRSFTLTTNVDVVSWTAPADSTSYTLVGGSAMANVTLSASSAAGYNVSYAANALPTGVSLSGNTISGTPTVQQNLTTLLTATAATTNRTASRTVSWIVNLGDTYWKYVTLFLNAATPTTTFINDASLNNSQLTIAGDTKPTKFSPYSGAYYSYFFDGTGDYLTIPVTTGLAFPGDYTIECWVYLNSVSGLQGVYSSIDNSADTWQGPYLGFSGTSFLATSYISSSDVITHQTTVSVCQWYHIAIVRSGNTTKSYLNGVQSTGTTTSTYSLTQSGGTIGSAYPGTSPLNGYISNLRVVKGTALYTSTFTPPTSPLTAISGTVLLTCQSNRIIDNGPSSLTLTVAGDTSVKWLHPFTVPTTSTYNTLYSTTFDGTGDYLTTAGNTALDMGTGDFTVECFVTTNGYAGSQYGRGIFALYPSGNYNNRLIVRHTTADNRLNLYGAAGGNPYLGTSGTDGASALVVGAWTHVAVVRQSGVFRLYINGVQDIVISNQTGISLASSNCFDIGRTQEGSIPDWNGVISNFRVIKGTCLYPNGTTFTVPSSTLTAVSGTSLLTCQSNTIKDNSSNAIAITVGNQAQPVAVSPFTMTTSTTTLTSLGSTYFDGTGDYISWNPASAGKFGTGDFTVELWFYPTITMTTQYLLEMRDAANTTGWVLAYGVNVSGSISWYNGTGSILTEATPLTKINQWNHVAFCRSGTSNRLFINGVQTNVTVTDSTNYNNNNTTAYIGSRYDQNTSITSLFTGYMSDVRIIKGTALYTNAFLSSQAPLAPVANTQLLTFQYNGGANNSGIIDQSSFNNNLTRFGNITQGTFSPYSQTGWSTYFGTTTMGVQTPASSVTNLMGQGYFSSTITFTVEAWIYPLSRHSGGGASFGYILGDMNISGGTLYWSFGPDSNGKLTLGWYTGSVVLCNSTNAVPLHAWTHIAVSVNAGAISLFINGIKETLVGTTSTSNVSGNGTLGYLAVGGYTYGGTTWQGFNGYISNLRLVKSALYSATFTPSTTPLSSIANTSLLTFQNNRVVDNSFNGYTLTPVNTPSVQAYSPFGGVTSVPTTYSTYFDGGTSTQLILPSNAMFSFGTGAYTMEAWIYIISPSASVATIFDAGNATNSISLGVAASGAVQIGKYGVGTALISTAGDVLSGQWVHVAASRNSTATNDTRIFVNGVLKATGTDAFNWTVINTPTIGGINLSGFTTNGYISNLRIIKGTALYTTSFTPSTTPLTTTSQSATSSQVSLLTCQSSTIVDNSINNFSFTAGGTVLQKAFNPFSNTISTLVAYDPAIHGGSIYMDGTGDYLTAVNSKSFDLSAGKWTIECWFYQLAPKQVQLFSISAAQWRLAVDTSGGAGFTFNTSSTTSYPAGSFPAGQWNHISASFNDDGTNSGQRSHANGKLVATGQYIPGADTTSLFYVGNNKDAAGAWDFNGYMTDIRITKGECLYYNSFVPSFTALPKTKNTAFLLNGTSGGIIDYHSSINLETVGNTQLGSEDPYGGTYYSNYFDGTGDRLTFTGGAPFNFGSGDFTIEAWVNPQSFGNAGLVFFSNFIPSSFRFVLYLSSTGIGIDAGGQFTTSGTTTCSLGTWYHCAVTKTGTSIKTFVNGVQISTATAPATYWVTANTNVTVGDYSDDYSTGYGYVSNLRVIKGQALYSGTFTPSTSPLTSSSVGSTGSGAAASITGTVSLLTCQSNKFIDNSSNNAIPTVSGNSAVKSINPFQQNTGKSLYFDGNGDYIANYTGAVNLVDDKFIMQKDFTIEAWIYPTSTNIVISCLGNETTNRFIFFLSSSNQLAYDVYLVGTTTFTPTITQGAWSHVALVRSGSTVTCYLNGSSIGTGSNSGTLGSGPLSIGVNGSRNGAYWSGYIKDLRITKGIARYTSTFTPPTSSPEVK